MALICDTRAKQYSFTFSLISAFSEAIIFISSISYCPYAFNRKIFISLSVHTLSPTLNTSFLESPVVSTIVFSSLSAQDDNENCDIDITIMSININSPFFLLLFNFSRPILYGRTFKSLFKQSVEVLNIRISRHFRYPFNLQIAASK